MSNTKQTIDRILASDKELEIELLKESGQEGNTSFTYITKTLEESPLANLKGLSGKSFDMESIVLAKLRPVFTIRDNKVIPEFNGPSSEVWKDRIMKHKTALNKAIPSIGRIEVKKNFLFDWVGTGWLVDHDIIVTNRHVAEQFSCHDEDFTFRMGYPDGLQSSNVDFLEEYGHSRDFEFQIEKVLWMSPSTNDAPDLAFLKVLPAQVNGTLPAPLELATEYGVGDIIATIGYPARDERIPDQKLVREIFGDVYDKKRLAPGEITHVEGAIVKHDCSTLGGNSGSPLILIKNGKVAGLHFAGLYKEANFAVSSLTIAQLLTSLKAGTLNKKKEYVTNLPAGGVGIAALPLMNNQLQSNQKTFEFNIPIKITVEVGTPSYTVVQTEVPDITEAVEMARKKLSGNPGVVSINEGYRFRNGWITDEKVIAIEIREKQSLEKLKQRGFNALPATFMGYETDIRNAGLYSQLEDLGINPSFYLELPKPGVYMSPPPPLKLIRCTEKMDAIFHVSPDSGWPNLKKFLENVEEQLTATIYEWDAEHISDILYEIISTGSRRLKMVTQKTGTKEAVQALKMRLGTKFEHRWASVGRGKIVPSAYHIKVASRDDKEFWLSSGNWKNSNQTSTLRVMALPISGHFLKRTGNGML
ncbi:trypsin-like peptidase domain-containing protein [Flavobacterium alkalisoli]|uniref:trypsin-like peptidase domain-containing protein n=1 Tax=Flavobacterium alkalisoli TaxID=2602769 RepID=UPI003A91BECB